MLEEPKQKQEENVLEIYSQALESQQFNLTIFISKIVLLIVIVYFSFILFEDPDSWVVLDYANLGIHEGGHLIFSIFGTTANFLGGTIFQLLVPILFALYFLIKKSAAGVSFCVFWLGVSLLNVGWYIKDASKMVIPLLGGGIHDWNWLLTKWGLLDKDILIGNWVNNVGFGFLILSMVYLIVSILLDGRVYLRNRIE